ncbi:MAG TPA: alpha/beta fold hydrolase, partial [Anaeromyxobacteraceae bacterium]|nr:alpha/beta fold hydrolase [Anaeromyxobacteraceae bacterium]
RQPVHPIAAPVLVLLACSTAGAGASALLHPPRRPIEAAPPLAHRDVAVESDGATLRGWRFPANGPVRRAAVVYLHGFADNRASGIWIAEKLVPRGHDVIVYDARAHGASGGAACTWGAREKRDLSRVLDALGIERAIVLGVSLGAAVALQAAAGDPRIVGVVSVATFADLASIARERAPPVVPDARVRAALEAFEREAGFRATDVSAVASAAQVRVPVLVVHGADDRETPPSHSRRVFEALAGPKRLRIVEGAGHNDALGKAWPEVERWIAETAGPNAVGRSAPASAR